MKTTLLICGSTLALLCTPSSRDQNGDDDPRLTQQDAATLYTFTGKLAFHDKGNPVRYDLTIAKGQVSGWQFWGRQGKPVARIVGGWFDSEKLRFSVLIQGGDHTQALWRSQLKQFHLDLAAREVVCDYELYDYGRRNDTSPVGAGNVLDRFDRIEVEHLAK